MMTTRQAAVGFGVLALVVTAAGTASAQHGFDVDPPGLVRLHIESDNPRVQLYSVVGYTFEPAPKGNIGTARLVSVCGVPCGRLVDARSSFGLFFGGKDITTSSEIELRDKQGDIRVRVRAGNRYVGEAGLSLTAIGTSAGVLGAFGVALQSVHDGSARIPAAVASVGGVMLVVGLPLYFVGRTTFELVPAQKGVGLLVGPGGLSIRF